MEQKGGKNQLLKKTDDFKEFLENYDCVSNGQNLSDSEKTIHQDSFNKLESYRNVLEILSQSTDDFLFLFDIAKDENLFFGDIDKKFSLREKEKRTNTTAQMLGIVHPADRGALLQDLKEVAEGRKDVHNMEYRWISRSGQIVWINCRGKVIRDEEGKPFVMIGRVSEEAVRHMYNPLTGLKNKIKLMADLKAKLTLKKCGYFMLIDIDDLAAINLTHGRKYADELLKEFAATLEGLEKARKVYHVENNCFGVCLDACSGQEVENIYAYIQSEMSEKCTFTAGAVPMDNSIFLDENKLYDSAKIILGKAKSKDKGNLEFFSEAEINQKIYSLELLEEFQDSINNNFEGFFITYQPQVKAGSYKIFSAEALIRYHSKSGDKVFPDEFIPLLEQSKLIIEVGEWVLEQALLQCRAWREAIDDMRVSVNFSTVQFKDEYVVKKISDILKKTDMPGSALTIEITESIPLHEVEHFSNVISKLKEFGIQIAIDDFGTGYSNIGYLKQLDIDEIKIDRMFVRGIEEDTYNYNVIRNTIEFAKMNSIRVCCEGVETMRELMILETLASDIMQGYLFDKPYGAEDFKNSYIDTEHSKFKSREKFVRKLYQYKEKKGIIRFNPRDILRETNLGLWIIRINEAEQYFEMHADETMEKIMGVDRQYTPQECYDFWYSRVKDGYVGYVQKNVQVMCERNKVVQLQYPWIHPELGEVIVRSSGKRVEDSDGMIVLEGYHRIFSNIEEL